MNSKLMKWFVWLLRKERSQIIMKEEQTEKLRQTRGKEEIKDGL